MHDFADAKTEAALLLSALNMERHTKSLPLIQPDAVTFECKTLQDSITGALKSGSLLRDTLRLFISANKHTLVAYAVGYHREVLDKDQSSLENKVAFQMKSSGNGIGRGSAGQGRFVFGFLDWRNDLSQRRLDEFMTQGAGRLSNLRDQIAGNFDQDEDVNDT
jgi:hypothetical protein